MENRKPFSCPHCRRNLPFRFFLKVKSGHQFQCPFCGEAMVPLKAKSFIWGYTIGFLSFVIPQQIHYYLHQDILLSFLIGLLHSLTAFGLVSLYLYYSTGFVKPSSLP